MTVDASQDGFSKSVRERRVGRAAVLALAALVVGAGEVRGQEGGGWQSGVEARGVTLTEAL
ncbi:MAG: hypothetical protein JJE01_11885, partial [Gemmatimonadetes bacterium]|nr:hypothetical protein [Gemmatimonadota bacterium]